MSGAISAAARRAPSRLDRAVVDGAVDLLGDRLGDRPPGRRRRVVHAAAGAVPLQPMADVAVLLEVVPQREVQERPARGRGQLHRRRQAALDDREVAGDEVAVQVRGRTPGPRRRPAHRARPGRSAARRPRSSAGPGTRRAASGIRRDDPPQQRLPHPGAADGDDHDPLVVAGSRARAGAPRAARSAAPGRTR